MAIATGLCGATFSSADQIWLKQTLEGGFAREGGWNDFRFRVEQEKRFCAERLVNEIGGNSNSMERTTS